MVVLATQTPAFERLALRDWRQFGDVEIHFHPRLTVMTGANATGKSTVLSILARHFNWSRTYSPAPLRGKLGKWQVHNRSRKPAASVDPNHWSSIGELQYGSRLSTEILVPRGDDAIKQAYDVLLPNQQPITGLFLTSHRTTAGNYAPVSSIPATFSDPDQMFEQYTGEIRNRWAGSYSSKTPQATMKESIIAAAIFGDEHSRSVEPIPDATEVWQGFQRVLSDVLPRSLGYRRLRVRVPDVIIESDTGDFLIDEASGGLSAIIEIAWQVFLRSRRHDAFSLLLDEPENHLHPKLQREILPSLLRSFPHVQFIVATHSPFVVTATADSTVYAMDYQADRKVSSTMLDYANKAGSADETLKRVLGMDTTVPIWAEERFDTIVRRYLGGSTSSEQLARLRAELHALGMENAFPSAVVEVTDHLEGGAE